VAQTLLLLEVARADVEQGRAQASFVCVEGGRTAGLADPGSERFAAQVGAMYCAWADKRRMRTERLVECRGGDDSPYRLLLSVSGFGAYSILEPEDGLHVLEMPAASGRGYDRVRAHVHVLPQVGDPGDGGPRALRRMAEEALAERSPGEPRIVRRYRLEPSPLVRDAVRGWRTGRIDRVLGGDFDLIPGDDSDDA
jgi:ATP-dependent Clp protease ATP-binding subunit ClpC